jgi:hypothetical protein
VLRFLPSVLRAAVLALFGIFLASLLPRGLSASLGRIALALRQAGETPAEARLRVYGSAVTAAYERLRRAIPRDGEYLLIDGGTEPQASALWTRYELAPRKARLLGRWDQLPSSEVLRRSWPPGSRFVVIALPEGNPPQVMEKDELLAALDRPHALR